MTSEQAIVKSEYQAGKFAFERGKYREAVQHLEKASALVARNTRLGGEIQIWLVTAYEAAEQRQEAVALCEQLKRHPHSETSKQARRLLYILQAPQLKRPQEWLTQIPDLGALPDNDSQTRLGSDKVSKKRPSQTPVIPEPIDLSKVNTKDNRFIWVALIAIALTLAGLIWSI
ncbi:tetratricopeptide repeat protein [Gloeocapsopsis dulcis]|uniref:Tetratricopeptide repeat protein n=1 Tax=Gloeocapsopsis dulcis AAB1 = 1H9 TaxID=1433147 RepID=A0A6N8G0F5_9CHRO|nr:tetratricopeptide repeat protein [Gloeocapsopsis dulcis]MUL38589.1 hypothetical protein [Gloeocapsopsis dulcis AAB1 = 1H9]WNN91149.1 tetratricopeptide repeat protein [Gloeocapsopsis dulcis]